MRSLSLVALLLIFMQCTKTKNINNEPVESVDSNSIADTESTTPDQLIEIPSALNGNWVSLMETDSGHIIFHPCDAVNDNFLVSERSIIYSTGQEAVPFEVKDIEELNGGYQFKVGETGEETIWVEFANDTKSLANWKINDYGPYLFATELKSTEYLQYNQPCKECFDYCDEEETAEAESGEDCIFDQETQTDEFLHGKPEFEGYVWNDESKTASMALNGNDSLLIFRGGCAHFGISIKMLIEESDTINIENYQVGMDQLLKYASLLFSESDFKILSDGLSSYGATKEEYPSTDTVLYIFEHDFYCEFSLWVRRNNTTGKLEFEVGYYVC